MSTFQEKIMAKKIKKLEAQVAVLKTCRPDIYLKCEFDNMKTRLEVRERIKEENKKLKEENQVLKQNAKNHSDVVDYWSNENEKLKEEKGKFHKDKRITVRSCDDRAEYNRQVMFLKSNPECKFIPERKWTKKSKDQPLEIS